MGNHPTLCLAPTTKMKTAVFLLLILSCLLAAAVPAAAALDNAKFEEAFRAEYDIELEYGRATEKANVEQAESCIKACAAPKVERFIAAGAVETEDYEMPVNDMRYYIRTSGCFETCKKDPSAY